MADYKAIKGLYIQNLSSDPSNLVIGDIWYNSTLGKIRGAKLPAGSWASSNNVNTARRSMAGIGIQTAGLIAGGIGGTTSAEEYDGSSWTNGGSINTGRQYLKGAGTQTAGIVFGGVGPSPDLDETETYDGSSWTEVGDINTARQKMGSTTRGTQTAALCFGGQIQPQTNSAANESWNGTAWTEVADLNTNRRGIAGAGTTTAGLAFGGAPGSGSEFLDNSETWNGTGWTEGNNMNTARDEFGGNGTSTSALGYGGNPNSPGALCEQYDGTSWSEVADISVKAAGNGHGGASGQSAFECGGYDGSGNLNTTEEFTQDLTAVSFDTT